MAGRFQDKVAIITGSGGSIGRAAALAFAREGANVVGCDLDGKAAAETDRIIAAAGHQCISPGSVDLAEPGGMAAVAAFAFSHYGRIDILYNNAAMAHFAWFEDLDYAGFQRNTRDELDIVFHGCKAVWPHFVAQKSGVIINQASVSGMICYEALAGLAHSTAKAGVLGMTRHLAMECAKHGIRANCLSPGLILTTQSQPLFDDPHWRQTMMGKIMLDRPGAPEDVAAAAVFLSSDEAAWITGANLPVDGGTTAW